MYVCSCVLVAEMVIRYFSFQGCRYFDLCYSERNLVQTLGPTKFFFGMQFGQSYQSSTPTCYAFA